MREWILAGSSIRIPHVCWKAKIVQQMALIGHLTVLLHQKRFLSQPCLTLTSSLKPVFMSLQVKSPISSLSQTAKIARWRSSLVFETESGRCPGKGEVEGTFSLSLKAHQFMVVGGFSFLSFLVLSFCCCCCFIQRWEPYFCSLLRKGRRD